jgi:CRISPR-associated protein Cmr6
MKNLSWLFYKQYFKNLKFDKSDQDKEKIKYRNKELINAGFTLIENPMAKQCFEMLIRYPGLATGVGISHEAGIEGEFKLGVHFDYTRGMPVIYGSSVKGLLRSAFPEKEKNSQLRKAKTALIRKYLGEGYENTDVDALRDSVFEGKEEKKSLSIYERDIFFDAVIKRPYHKTVNRQVVERIVESDSVTPHVKQGIPYEKSMLKNPVPITFLKIVSGVTMEFRFDLKDCIIGRIEVSADDKKRLFKQILLDFGIGAKTNVGYGQFQQ